MTRAERALAKRAEGVQAELFYARAVDVARRERATARMGDVGIATRYALAEGADIADDLAERAARNPWAAQALSGIAEDGIRGLRHELRALQED
ncbi:MAG: hypothetical protein ABSB69_07590 [Solirubrobacteraceae bacterium]|jgi:hypothetical protein